MADPFRRTVFVLIMVCVYFSYRLVSDLDELDPDIPLDHKRNRLVSVAAKPKSSLTLLLPVTLEDFPRTRVLDASMAKFFDFEGIEEFIFITIDTERDEVEKKTRDFRIQKKVRISVVPESKVVPEFDAARAKNHMGWIKQQIIKLTAFRIIHTDFYLILDSDIICVRECGVHDLIVDGKARTNMCKMDADGRPLEDTLIDWWIGAEKVLGLKIPQSEELRFGVTPAILSRRIVADMAGFVERTFQAPYSKHLVDHIWDSFTEYALYFTFASSQGLFDEYHHRDFFAVYKQPHYNVWWKDQFDRWNGDEVFHSNSSGYFITIQSNTKISADEVWEKVRKYVE